MFLLLIKFSKIKRTLIAKLIPWSELIFEIHKNNNVLHMFPHFLTKTEILRTKSLMSQFLNQWLYIITDMPKIKLIIEYLSHNKSSRLIPQLPLQYLGLNRRLKIISINHKHILLLVNVLPNLRILLLLHVLLPPFKLLQ